jgi:hypothetical protein
MRDEVVRLHEFCEAHGLRWRATQGPRFGDGTSSVKIKVDRPHPDPHRGANHRTVLSTIVAPSTHGVRSVRRWLERRYG